MKRVESWNLRLSVAVLAAALVALPVWSGSEAKLSVGSSAVDGASLPVYAARWSQEANQGGEWTPRGFYVERLTSGVLAGESVIHHTQIVEIIGRGSSTAERTFDRGTLELLRLETESEGQLPPGASRHSMVDFDGRTFTGSKVMPEGDTQEISGELPMSCFDASVFGLVLAALPLEEGYSARLPAALVPQVSAYWVTVTVLGKQSIEYGGVSHEAWIVDTSWEDLGSNDVYPGGESGSGGTYHIALDAGGPIPPVLAYLNSQVRIEYVGAD